MSKQSVPDLIDAWKSRRDLADEIGATKAQVDKWAQFGRIPARWQLHVIEAAARNGIEGIDAAWMVRVHARARGAA